MENLVLLRKTIFVALPKSIQQTFRTIDYLVDL